MDETQMIPVQRDNWTNPSIPEYKDFDVKEKDKSTTWIAVAAAIAVVVFIILPTTLFATHSWPFKSASDSGVQACMQIAHNAASGDSSDDGSTMTQDDLRKALKPWQDSHYNDLKIAGTNVINTVYKIDTQMSATTDEWEQAGVGLGGMSLLVPQWAALQTACLNHGVTIPSLNG